MSPIHPAHPIGLVAIDLDGTLLQTDEQVSQRAIRVIGEVSHRGIPVVLASARPPRSARRIYDQLKLDTLQINYNGALINDPVQHQSVFHQPLEADLAKQIIQTARGIDSQVIVDLEILDRGYTDRIDPTLTTQTSQHFQPNAVGPLGQFLDQPVTKLMLLAPPQRLGSVRAAVEHRFADRVRVHVSDPHLIQVVHPKVDKAHALAKVAETYRVPRQRVMAVGDAPNDIGMLRWAGWGVAMGNGWEAVRAAADAVVPGNDEDGVAHALQRYVLEA